MDTPAPTGTCCPWCRARRDRAGHVRRGDGSAASPPRPRAAHPCRDSALREDRSGNGRRTRRTCEARKSWSPVTVITALGSCSTSQGSAPRGTRLGRPARRRGRPEIAGQHDDQHQQTPRFGGPVRASVPGRYATVSPAHERTAAEKGQTGSENSARTESDLLAVSANLAEQRRRSHNRDREEDPQLAQLLRQ